MLSLQHHQDLQTEWELQSESCFHVETVRNSSGRKHYWEERTRMSAAVGGSESTSSSRLLERRAPWEGASYSGRFSISHQRSDPRPPGPHPSPSLWTVCTQTWADDPCVLLMSAVVLPPAPGRARPHVRLISSAVQVVQPDGSWSRPKVSRPRGIEGFSTAQLPAHHAGRPGPSRHHRWCPRSPGQGSPLSRRRDRPRPPGGAVCCLRREKWDNGGVDRGMRRVFCPVGPSPEQ